MKTLRVGGRFSRTWVEETGLHVIHLVCPLLLEGLVRWLFILMKEQGSLKIITEGYATYLWAELGALLATNTLIFFYVMNFTAEPQTIIRPSS